MLLSFYFKSWPSVKEKIEWLLISFIAADRRPSLREEKQCHYATIEEKCQREKNKYDFFSSSFHSFLTSMNEKTTIDRHERTYLTNHRVCFSILFHVPLGQMATDTRPTSWIQSIDHLLLQVIHVHRRKNENALRNVSHINEKRKYVYFTFYYRYREW